MTRRLTFTTIAILLQIVLSVEQRIRTDNHVLSLPSLCSINRPGFGQFEHVHITSNSIEIQFKNIFSDLQCSSILIHAQIINTHTNRLERVIENIQSNIFHIDGLRSSQNYSITIKISNEQYVRILPTHIFQTLEATDHNILTLTNKELLTVEQIESFIFPHTHLYIVTMPNHIHRLNLLGNITLTYNLNGKQYMSHHIVKPLGNNVITGIGRTTAKTIAFSIELPYDYNISDEYSSSIQLFLANDQRQSIVDHSVRVQYPQPITVDFLSLSTRSVHVFIQHLCSPYIEVKATLHNNRETFRRQCDIGKKDTRPSDITNGECSLVFDKLQPEENYTLSIRTTCPVTTSSSLSFMFYDRARAYSFQTPSGVPDGSPFVLSFHNNNRTLSWKDLSANMSYLGPEYYYELFTKSNENWTLIYRGNETQYQLQSKFIERSNLTFRLYVGNYYGRQENNYTEIDVHIDPIYHTNSNNQIVIVIILISILFLTICGFVIVVYYLRHKTIYGKLKTKYGQNGVMSDKELDHLRSLTYCSTLKDNILYTWNHTPTNIDISKLPKIDRVSIKLERLIGKGAFGEVYAGALSEKRPVAIKTLPSSASESQRVDFLKEAIIMNQFDHKHIIHLLGVCFHQDYHPQFLVIELMEQGDLQNFLRRSRPSKDNNGQCQLSYNDCLSIAGQIADGACYLEQHAYVHRDLAARNCLVSSSETIEGKILVKIADFGLARMLSQQDYYRKTGEALLPVRWMAPESLLDGIFTSNSDMWSFGIVLWEIITLGQIPYSPMNNQQVVSLITTTRGTLEKPLQCTQILYELMISCWQYVPENRINFSDLHTRLNEMLHDENKEQPSIWFSNEEMSQSARNMLSSVLSHIEPPISLSYEGSDTGECRSSTSGCFSSMTDSTSPTRQHRDHQRKETVPPYQLRLIDDTTSNDFADDEGHSDIIARSC